MREALKRLSSLDILASENGQNVLYVEDESDFKILAEFARVLKHELLPGFAAYTLCLSHPRAQCGRRSRPFSGLKAIRPQVKGVFLLGRREPQPPRPRNVSRQPDHLALETL